MRGKDWTESQFREDHSFFTFGPRSLLLLSTHLETTLHSRFPSSLSIPTSPVERERGRKSVGRLKSERVRERESDFDRTRPAKTNVSFRFSFHYPKHGSQKRWKREEEKTRGAKEALNSSTTVVQRDSPSPFSSPVRSSHSLNMHRE